MKTGMRSVFWAALLCVGTLRPPVAHAAFPKVTAAHGSAAGAYFGAAVAVIEDSDADGQCDLLIGGFQGSCGVGSTCNEVYLYSALEGTRLQTFTDSGSEVPSLFGVHVASIGDVDDDDAPDVVVGAPTYATDDVNDVERGRVYVFSGDDGTEIYHIDGPRTYGWFGGAILAERDFNDDGIRDLVVSAHGKDGGSDKSVHLYDGEDGSLIWTVMNPSAEDGELFGFSLAVTDIDEDGTPELVV
ncbi:MAG: VCBS repeat-containing protein, partial [Candidatus Methylomirabilis sp.]|nr:VCBS repeat-containing protein [Deltaproteobacteria bacterium]